MDEQDSKQFMQEAIDLSFTGMANKEGGPFGAVVVRNNEIIGRGNNRVTKDNDPTSHAEINAIRDACKNIGSFQLTDCVVYTSCEPCPMCLAAIYWARVKKIYFGCSRIDAAAIGFDDDFIYEEIKKSKTHRSIEVEQISRVDAIEAFLEWENKIDKVKY
ncbi:MAG: nucleoside deaminase [Bacteroidetes bacterium]|nr:nucleoside deaminase [Bacteroidota bacterium]